jgi:2'-5' RNA ligase
VPDTPGDDTDGYDDQADERWRRPAGLFVLGVIDGPAADRIAEVQRRFDPKFAAAHRPHLTLTGSSGVGPIAPDTPLDDARAALDRVARATPPLDLVFGAPTRFMQTNVFSLPLDPHGALRTLHERIARSGLGFGPVRFTFTPHVTLSFYPTLSRDRARELLAVRIVEPARLTRLTVSATDDPLPPRPLFEVVLSA